MYKSMDQVKKNAYKVTKKPKQNEFSPNNLSSTQKQLLAKNNHNPKKHAPKHPNFMKKKNTQQQENSEIGNEYHHWSQTIHTGRCLLFHSCHSHFWLMINSIILPNKWLYQSNVILPFSFFSFSQRKIATLTYIFLNWANKMAFAISKKFLSLRVLV